MRDIASHSHLVRTVAALVISLFVLLLSASAADTTDTKYPVKTDSTLSATDDTSSGKLIITYFYGNVRCATCRKLEAFAQEAIDSNFANSLKDSSATWRVVNFDEDANNHFLQEYQLYGQALILSYMVDGKEKTWRNLDKIWVLVGDKAKYQAYVRDEVASFLAEQER
jgi:hypothetical protein